MTFLYIPGVEDKSRQEGSDRGPSLYPWKDTRIRARKKFDRIRKGAEGGFGVQKEGKSDVDEEEQDELKEREREKMK